MSMPRFYGADAARLVRELELPKVVQQGIRADAALTVAVRAEQTRERNDRRKQWLTLAGYLIEKEDRNVDRA
jgi:hypothetical protein